MANLGSIEGHEDVHDSVGTLTSMIANSRLPSGYEAGRFHLLWLGCYLKSTEFKIVSFCGLYRHGGTPPIAPKEVAPAAHAYRLMVVCYPPQSIMSQAGTHIVPFASLPNGKSLTLGPEITSHRWVAAYTEADKKIK